MMAEKGALNVDEVASYLGISRSKAYELVHKKGFPRIQLGRRLLVPLAALDKWLMEEATVESSYGGMGGMDAV